MKLIKIFEVLLLCCCSSEIHLANFFAGGLDACQCGSRTQLQGKFPIMYFIKTSPTMYPYSFYRCFSFSWSAGSLILNCGISCGLQHRQCRASEHRAEHSEILQDTGVYSTNCTSNIVRLFAKLVYWHRFHTRAACVEIWRLTTAPGFFLAAGWITVVVDHGRLGGWQ